MSDPPAATMEDSYPPSATLGEDEEEQPDEEDDAGEAGSFIKMDESHEGTPPAVPSRPQEQAATKEEPDENDQSGPVVGGSVDTKAFCLLDGIFEQKDGNQKRVTIPLTRLPAVLGRSHSTIDNNFFSLGPAKALSRQHCVIDYRDSLGGKLVTPKTAPKESSEEGKLEYQKGKPFKVVNAEEDDNSNDKENSSNSFPPRGAFTLEALGKNLIMLGSKRLRQGEVAILKSGTPIRMSTYSLYFLLPTDTTGKTMDIPLQESKAGSSNKKGPAPVISGGFKRKMPGSTSSEMPKPKVKKPKAAPFAQLQAELDALPIGTLLERMNEAVESERWERKHQLIGSTISLHAVKDATSAPTIREQAADGGVARTEIMRWIKESPKYANWVEQMMSKMEAKSYQNTITKALLKAGNVRTGSGGRYIKWILPGVKLRTTGEGGGDKPASEGPKEGGAKENEEEGEEEEEGGDEHDNEEEAGAGENEEEEGEEEEEEEEGGKEPFNAGPPATFADFGQEEESDDEEAESMMREAASFGGDADSGNEFGHESHESPSQPDMQEDESMG